MTAMIFLKLKSSKCKNKIDMNLSKFKSEKRDTKTLYIYHNFFNSWFDFWSAS